MIPEKEKAQLDQLNESLGDLFRQLEPYSDEQLNRQPDPATWSPLMVMKHMLLAEKYSIQYIQKKLSYDPQLDKAGFRSGFRKLILDLYFNTPLKWKAPKAIADKAVQGPHRLESLKAEWWETRAQLEKLLAELPPKRYEEELYKHPFVGRLSVNGTLGFFRGHFKRHRQQILERI